MQHYKVITASITGYKGKHLKEGEIHKDTEFIASNCAELEKAGFIEKATEEQYNAYWNPTPAAQIPEGMVEFVITKDYLKEHPELKDQGKKVGDTIYVAPTPEA